MGCKRISKLLCKISTFINAFKFFFLVEEMLLVVIKEPNLSFGTSATSRFETSRLLQGK
jgi:hypothetical protein